MLDSIDVTTSADASAALDTISGAIEQLLTRASYGAMQNRLEYTVSNLLNVAEFTTGQITNRGCRLCWRKRQTFKSSGVTANGYRYYSPANAASQLALQLIR